MNKYKIEYWYRYGQMEKDYEIDVFYANTEEEAIEQAKESRKWVYKTKVLEINDVKVEMQMN